MSEPKPHIVELSPGTPRLNIWCDGCLTSARYEIDVYTFSQDGLSLICTVKRCHRCDDDAQ